MSRGNVEQKNPATKKFEWKGKNGILQYYDKATEDNIPVPLPFKFLVLDQLSGVGGYSSKHKKGFYSNEVRYTKKETLSVWVGKEMVGEGFYTAVIGLPQLKGAKYAKVVYIAYFEGKELTIGKMFLTGAANSAWIEFSKTTDVEKGAVELVDMKQETNGDTEYFVPIFQSIAVSKETDEKAIQLNNTVLQPYLATRLAAKDESVKNAPVESTPQGTEFDDISSEPTIEDNKKIAPKVAEPTDDLPF